MFVNGYLSGILIHRYPCKMDFEALYLESQRKLREKEIELREKETELREKEIELREEIKKRVKLEASIKEQSIFLSIDEPNC